MIGKNLSLIDTGAPTEGEVRRLEEEARRTRASARPARFSGLAWLLAKWSVFWRRVSYQRRQPVRAWRELSALALFVMGLSWAVPWFRSLSSATQVGAASSTFVVFFGLGMAAYISMRLLSDLRVTPAKRNRILLVLLVLSVLVGLRNLLYAKEVMPLTELVLRPLVAFGNFSALIPNEIIVAIAVLLVWRRGAVLSLDYLGPERVMSEFKTGFWMFLLFAGLNTLVTKEAIPFAYMGLYLFCGLMAMGAARMSAVSEVRGGNRNRFDRRRFASVIFGVAFAAGLAVWIGFNVSKDDAALAGALVLLAVLAAFIISVPLLLACLYLLYEGLRLFQDEIAATLDRLMNLIAGLTDFLEELKTWIESAGSVLADRLVFLAPLFRWLFSLAPAMRLFVLLGSLLLVGGLVYMAFWIRARRLRDPEDLDSDSVLSAGSLVDLFRRRMQRAYEQSSRLIAGVLNIDTRRKQRFAARIRRLYRQLLDLATRLGVERSAAQTPLEYQRALARLFPEQEQEVVLLTEAYLRVRYGEIPENRREVIAAENAFKKIRAAAAGHYKLTLKKG